MLIMKYLKIEVERTYTTEVYVKCKDEKTAQDVLDASFSERVLFDAQTNLWDHILEEEMEQCVVENQIATIVRSEDLPNWKHTNWYFDLDAQIIED